MARNCNQIRDILFSATESETGRGQTSKLCGHHEHIQSGTERFYG